MCWRNATWISLAHLMSFQAKFYFLALNLDFCVIGDIIMTPQNSRLDFLEMLKFISSCVMFHNVA